MFDCTLLSGGLQVINAQKKKIKENDTYQNRIWTHYEAKIKCNSAIFLGIGSLGKKNLNVDLVITRKFDKYFNLFDAYRLS